MLLLRLSVALVVLRSALFLCFCLALSVDFSDFVLGRFCSTLYFVHCMLYSHFFVELVNLV